MNIMTDEELEKAIEEAREKMTTAKNRFDRYLWANELTKLVNQRSSEQVKRMEKERGLR
jgi:hypothetical protein